MIKGTG